jgi:predicted nucleotidyltransferase
MDYIIKRKLSEIENKHPLRILFAVESGSRAWGFSSSDSDYDVRFVYALPEREYMRLEQPKDHFELMDGDLDISGWEIRKALKLMLNGNFTIREWLQSPIVYADRWAIDTLKKLAHETPCRERLFYSYRSLLNKVIKDYLDIDMPNIVLKKYFYALRSAFAMKYVQEHSTNIPPMSLIDLMNALTEGAEFDSRLYEKVLELVELKKTTPEFGYGPRIPVIDKFLLKHVDSEFHNVFSKTDEKPMETLIYKYNKLLYNIILGDEM